MPLQPIPTTLAGLIGIALGFGAATLLLGHGPSASLARSTLTPGATEARAERGDPGGRGHAPEGEGASAADRAPSASPSPTHADRVDAGVRAEQRARAVELGLLRARERSARDELSKARGRIAQLEKEMAAERPRGEERTRPDYDLTPEDWKKLAAQQAVKYRVPCTSASQAPTDATLAQLGLAPEEYAIVREAFDNSIARQKAAIFPLCAAAIGSGAELVQTLNLQSCMAIISSTTSERSENAGQSARSVASYMAGDGARPDAKSPLLAQAFLALAEESKHFEDELAASFGPDDAHEITFSNSLCFSSSSHAYGPPPSAAD